MNKHLREIEYELKKLADPAAKISNEKFAIPRSIGMRSQQLTDRLKIGFSFSRMPDAEQWKIWNFIFRNSRQYETQMAALCFAEDLIKTNGKSEWNYLRGWVEFIDNWAHSDVLSKIYSFLLEHHPLIVLPTLRKWNRSKNPWKQRASIVSLIYYASKNRKAPPIETVLDLIEPLIKSRDKYVAKAVGWTLREASTLYPKKTLGFITSHIKQLAPDCFSYSTEKLSKKEKDMLKRLRSKS